MGMGRERRGLVQRLLGQLTLAPFKCKKLAVAVSGGCDSVALLLLMKDWCGIRGIEACVFHVDHQMRGNSSADAAWVEAFAKELGMEFYSRIATEEDKESNTELGQEGWARHLRYTSFASMVKESGADLIATGHNAEDQAETVVMRILRGCSLQGLGGIPSQTELCFDETNLKLWRPILRINRKDLERLLALSQIIWREDETNATNLYLRNRLRHDLLPQLEGIQPKAISHIIALGEDAREVQDYLSAQGKKYLKANSTEGRLVVKQRPEAILRREILRLWLEENFVVEGVTRGLIERLDDLWVRGHNNKTLCHRVFRVIWRKSCLYFEPGQEN